MKKEKSQAQIQRAKNHSLLMQQKHQERIKFIVSEFNKNEDLFLKDFEEIANHFGVKKRTVLDWRKFPEIKSILDKRKDFITTIRTNRKRKYDNLYQEYCKLHSESKKEGFILDNYNLIQSVRTIFGKMDLYTYKPGKPAIFNDLISEEEFNNRYVAVKNLKPIYIFNTKNELIDTLYNIRSIQKKYKLNHCTVRSRLNNPEKYAKDYYFSYDKNFKIVAVEPIKDNTAASEVNRLKSLESARRLENLFITKPEFLKKSINECGKELGFSDKRIYRYFEAYDFLKPYKKLMVEHREKRVIENKYNREVIQKQKREQQRKERKIKEKVSNIAKARVQKKEKAVKKSMTPEEVIELAKKQNKKVVRLTAAQVVQQRLNQLRKVK